MVYAKIFFIEQMLTKVGLRYLSFVNRNWVIVGAIKEDFKVVIENMSKSPRIRKYPIKRARKNPIPKLFQNLRRVTKISQ
jgi:hypothetical protein